MAAILRTNYEFFSDFPLLMNCLIICDNKLIKFFLRTMVLPSTNSILEITVKDGGPCIRFHSVLCKNAMLFETQGQNHTDVHITKKY